MIPSKLKAFGKTYVLQGVFENPEDLKTVKENWKEAGHSCMVKYKNALYVTQFKTRNW